MKILLSNDDGIRAPSLEILEEMLASLGEVWVVAPERDQSAVSHSVTLRSPLRMRRVRRTWYAVDGTPTDCISLGIHNVLNSDRPGLVIAGVNEGGNIGEDIVYSGTVSAAMEATLHGIPSLAVSLFGRGPYRHRMAAGVTTYLAGFFMRNPLPAETFLNINIPNVPAKVLRGIKVARQGKRILGDSVVEKIDPRGDKYYWLAGYGPGWEGGEGTDFHAVRDNYISITPLKTDLTDYDSLASLGKMVGEIEIASFRALGGEAST